jgi:hypothetical protein
VFSYIHISWLSFTSLLIFFIKAFSHSLTVLSLGEELLFSINCLCTILHLFSPSPNTLSSHASWIKSVHGACKTESIWPLWSDSNHSINTIVCMAWMYNYDVRSLSIENAVIFYILLVSDNISAPLDPH